MPVFRTVQSNYSIFVEFLCFQKRFWVSSGTKREFTMAFYASKNVRYSQNVALFTKAFLRFLKKNFAFIETFFVFLETWKYAHVSFDPTYLVFVEFSCFETCFCDSSGTICGFTMVLYDSETIFTIFKVFLYF